MIRLLFFLLLTGVNLLYAQDKNIYLPKGERHPYFNKFIYILDDDADHYFVAKAYRLLREKQDVSVDFLLYLLEKDNVYELPLQSESTYQTEPILNDSPQKESEYIIRWINGNKSYIMSVSNRYKERPNKPNLFFEGITMVIEENTDKSQITKEVKVQCWIGSYGTLVEYMNEDHTVYLIPPTIKLDKQKWLWLKEYERYTFPYVECRISSIEEDSSDKEFNIFIRDYFHDGFIGIPTEQTIDVTGNHTLANRYLKKHHIRIRETSYSRDLIERMEDVNIDFDSIQPLIRRIR